jgi:peptidoglycan/xylan/chitin deacetylase (PgdA/CDA1 family)
MLQSINYFFRGNGAILTYHRVLPDSIISEDSILNIAVSISNFRKQIKYLKNNFSILPINNFLRHINSESKQFKILITFDDGYKDNLDYAFPILKEFNVPAIIYVITKFIGNSSLPWWNKLDDFLRNSRSLKNKKKKFRYLKRVFLLGNQLKIDKQLPLFIDKNNKKNIQIFLNHKEVKYLSEQKLITIGSHSHSHYNFSRLEDKQAFNEFKVSKFILEKIIKKKITHFSYPYGDYENINFSHIRSLKQLGYMSAMTTIRNKIDHPDTFLLPRIFVNNDSNLFRLKLKLFGFKKFY